MAEAKERRQKSMMEDEFLYNNWDVKEERFATLGMIEVPVDNSLVDREIQQMVFLYSFRMVESLE